MSLSLWYRFLQPYAEHVWTMAAARARDPDWHCAELRCCFFQPPRRLHCHQQWWRPRWRSRDLRFPIWLAELASRNIPQCPAGGDKGLLSQFEFLLQSQFNVITGDWNVVTQPGHYRDSFYRPKNIHKNKIIIKYILTRTYKLTGPTRTRSCTLE